MKRYATALGLLISILSVTTLHAQNDYFVQFTDKDASPFSLDSPEEYLSQRAIDRRVAQDIAIDARDLPVDPAYVAAVVAIDGVELKYASKWFNGVLIDCDEETISEVESLIMVSGVEQTVRWENEDELEVALSPVDDSGTRLKNMLMIDYGQSDDQITDLNGQALHDLGFEGEGMVIAVLDSGFDNVDSMDAFEQLREDGRILSTMDMVEGDTDVYDGHGHGRFVLSTIAGIIEGEAYGTAVDASFHLIRTEDTDSESTIEELNWVVGAEYADSVGADVLNTSLGYTTFDEPEQDHTYSDLDGNTTWISVGSDIAASRGMLVINSAGNSGTNDWHFIGPPADGDSVLAIGAVRGDSIHASFSSYGPTFDGRVKPNVMAKGQGATIINADDEVFQANGTSFSSPILAGMAACLWQAVPEASNMEVFHAIEQSAHLFDMPNDSMGYGIPDFGQALGILQGTVISVRENEEIALILYPNPATDEVRVVLPEEFNERSTLIAITDLSGRQTGVRGSIGTNVIRVNTSDLSSGFYLLTVNDGENRGVARFMIY